MRTTPHEINMTALTMLIAVVTTLVVTRMVLGYASRRLLDQVNERSSHVAPTPRGGGLGLVVGLLVAWTTGLLLMGMWTAGAAGVGASVAALALLGWWDDHAGLSARTRLPLHLAAAAAVVWIIGLPDSVTIGIWTFAMPLWIMAPLAVIAATWLVNLTNFMDGIDGIAGSQGLIAGIAAAVVFASQPTWHLLGMATAGACLGFLWWNRPPARIFMGDVGSTALGLVFACFVLVQIRAGHSFDLALLPLTPFVLDATCTLFRRLWRRERASVAHRSHLYQRLSQHWGAHLPVTALYAGLALVGAAGAWAVNQGWVHPLLATTVAIGAFTACAMYGRRVAPA